MLLINTGELTKPTIKKDFQVDRRQTSLITGVYEQMGADLLTPGGQELIYGREIITGITSAAKAMPLVCSNLPAGLFPGLVSHVVLEKGGKKILVASAIDQRLEQKAIHGLTVLNPLPVLQKILTTEPHDLAIIVLHFSDRKARELLAEIPGFDLAILATQRGVITEPEKVGETYLVKNNNQGKTISYLDWDMTSRQPAAHGIFPVSKKDIVPDPAVDRQVSDYEEWLRRHYIELEQKAEETQPDQQDSTYMGVQACAPCHQAIVGSWQLSRHAKAYASLEKKCKDYCPDCLPCHVTGKNNPQGGIGFLTPKKTPHLFNIQCEQCHGSGHLHVTKPDLSYGTPIDEDTCVVCHTSQTDPDFSFIDDVKLIAH
ncbi:MAG: hypothetical protein JXO49_07805 [Deltaproteobacteria bacterium]|nr:hypothetical protein [Candidatus Anaeroferrophillus wilburensis]MBN2889232.1 hypothetical protein [Deltaproteobacteria bacterium]